MFTVYFFKENVVSCHRGVVVRKVFPKVFLLYITYTNSFIILPFEISIIVIKIHFVLSCE